MNGTRTTEWLLPWNPKQASPLLLFSACDTGYVDHAVSLIRSVDVFSPGFAFLLHVVNPSEAALERLQTLAAGLRNTRLWVSTESIDLSALSDEARRTYYACARFFRLAELVPQIKTPVLSLDADSLILNPIDQNFTDKPDAEICLVRRDQKDDGVEEHLAVATGTIWIRPCKRTIQFMQSVSDGIAGAFAAGEAGWYLDQLVFKRQMTAFGERFPIYNIKTKYADWHFKPDSIVWAGKGPRKFSDLRYVLLKKSLSDDPAARYRFLPMLHELGTVDELLTPDFQSRLRRAAVKGLRTRVCVFLPRLDLPWKKPKDPDAPAPRITKDTLALRLYWKTFTARLANVLEAEGIKVDVREIPAWEITRDTVEREAASLAFIPHRCHLDFEPGPTPVRFYMQEYFRWIFVVDEAGWSAASTVYPVSESALEGATASGAFDDYRRRLETGTLGSKFAQKQKLSLAELKAEGLVPDGPYIFFPLQIPHDQSIRYFSDVAEIDVVSALLAWAKERGIAVVLKPHPANLKSMQPFEALAREHGAVWSDANIDDLITHAAAVYTINSGVGFESLLRLKPVVTFGRAEYDCVTFNARPDALDDAWRHCQQTEAAALEARYRRFFDWFIDGYAIDLSRPEAAMARLKALADAINAHAGERR